MYIYIFSYSTQMSKEILKGRKVHQKFHYFGKDFVFILYLFIIYLYLFIIYLFIICILYLFTDQKSGKD